MLADTLANIYLGVRKSKSEDKAEPIPKKAQKNIDSFLLEFG